MVNWAIAFSIDKSNDDKVRKQMNRVNPILTRYAKKYGCAQALGLMGLSLQHANQLGDKYIAGDMAKYATGHSYMQVPSEAVMKHGYKQWVINRPYGVTAFGIYSVGAFPHGEQGD
jgi:hypothetical protein